MSAGLQLAGLGPAAPGGPLSRAGGGWLAAEGAMRPLRWARSASVRPGAMAARLL